MHQFDRSSIAESLRQREQACGFVRAKRLASWFVLTVAMINAVYTLKSLTEDPVTVSPAAELPEDADQLARLIQFPGEIEIPGGDHPIAQNARDRMAEFLDGYAARVRNGEFDEQFRISETDPESAADRAEELADRVRDYRPISQ